MGRLPLVMPATAKTNSIAISSQVITFWAKAMMSTPIINPPQSAILGIHATKERAVVVNGEVVVRPMNYFALSYDHRLIDGREAVLGLMAIKEALEDPARMMLDI